MCDHHLDVRIARKRVGEQHPRQADAGVVRTPDPGVDEAVPGALRFDRSSGRVEEDERPLLVREREGVGRVGRVGVPPAPAGREAEAGEAELERALPLGQRVGAAEGVDRGERGKPVRVLLEEAREEVMLALDLVHRVALVLEGEREDGAFDPRPLLLLEVALDVEEVAHEERRVRILAGEMRVEVDAHGARRVSHMGAPAAIA